MSFVNAIKDLSSDHKDAIKYMGFGGLLRMPGTCLRRQMNEKITKDTKSATNASLYVVRMFLFI